VTATLKGAMGVTTTGSEQRAEGSATVVEGMVLGVDTHLDFHVAVVLDHLGRRLGESKVPTTAGGYRRLVSWAEGFGPVRCVGVEGTGSYGAGLARHLEAAGIAVVEVERPKRRHLKAAAASPIPSTRRRPPGRFWPARRRACPRAGTAS
jgi:transposase